MENDSSVKRFYDPFNYTCNNGLLLPAISEATWSPSVRAFLYFIGMLWCFLAVAIIADTFMCSIERITSKTRRIKIADASSEAGHREYEVKVWNDTVANLTLLALGTSAPEILLSIIEIIGNRFRAGELGPGTIVGSATFNLFVISAICILAIPNNETRRIANLRVYAVTTVSSIFAYVWLIIILKASSPNQIEIWEAVLTLLFFPALVIIAYTVDKKCFCYRPKTNPNMAVQLSLEKTDFRQQGAHTDVTDGVPEDTGDKSVTIRKLAQELGRNRHVRPESAAKLAAARLSSDESHSRGWFRIHGIRQLSGGRRLIPASFTAFNQVNLKDLRTKEPHRKFS